MKRFIAILLSIMMLAVLTTACKRGSAEPVESEIQEESTSVPEAPYKPTTSEAASHNAAIKAENVRLVQFSAVKDGDEAVVFTTSEGEIKIRLFNEQAPNTVRIFKKLVEEGYYNGVPFETVVSGYKIETGGKNEDSQFPEEGEFSLDLWNFRGAVAIANNGNNFMIVSAYQCLNPISELEELNFPKTVIEMYEDVGGAPHQDWENTVFAQVFEGMDVVDKIADVKAKDDGEPASPVMIEKAEMAIISIEPASSSEESEG